MIVQLAESICYDPPMARMLGEIFAVIGEFGHFELRTGQGRGLEYEFVEGTYWEGPLHSKTMINRPLENRSVLENPAVLVTNFAIDDLHQLVHMITEAKKAGKTSLLLVCNSITEAGVGFLMMESTQKVLPVIAVKTPSVRVDEQMAAMEDIGVLTGAKPLTMHAGETLDTVNRGAFWPARAVSGPRISFLASWAGRGDPRATPGAFCEIEKTACRSGCGRDPATQVRQRIGKLMGGSAILWVGGVTEAEINVRKDMAERAAEAIRGAMLKGVTPGGGMAFLACKPALKEALTRAESPDEIAAYRILLSAMDAPAAGDCSQRRFFP